MLSAAHNYTKSKCTLAQVMQKLGTLERILHNFGSCCAHATHNTVLESHDQ
jgi:hypothetical protein